MKKILSLAFIVVALVAQAQMPATVQLNLPSIIEIFNTNKSNDKLAYWYAFNDVDGDGINEFAVSDYRNEHTYTFKIVGKKLDQIRAIPTTDVNWQPLFNIYGLEGRDASLDITLKHRPLFLNDINIGKNRFTTDNGTWLTEGVDVGKMKRTYNRIVFKPHIGNAKFVREKATGKNALFTFALTDASMARKMFRGYADTQATPFIVPHAWLNDHTPLNFTRWLNGEKEKTGSPDVIQLINGFYGDQQVIATKWLASCPINERHFYQVLFAPRNGVGLVAMVCIAEGEVVSVYNDWQPLQDGNKFTESGLDYSKEIFFYAPQIMAMVATPEGLELYVRWNSLEGMHYSIWREMDQNWIQIQDDYQYLQAF